MTPVAHQHLLAHLPLDAAEERALVATARALKRVAESGAPNAPLAGKNIALLCAEPDGEFAREFDAAAGALGARVARIEPEPQWLSGESGPSPDTVRMLARLYDAIDCEAMPAGFARALQQQVGVPVYDGLAQGGHPIARLLPQLAAGNAATDPADRRYLMQALLVETMA